MPYGFERLNERSQRPNALINFIKPLETPDKTVAEDFLNRIAAQCYPIMKAAHIAVMSLEEYEPNSEFLGRNFNAGECIQLVLKNKQGQWLSFKYVQLVMMHELAHCKQMNHGRDFWKVRNGFAEEMEGLWTRKYHGEGVWGRGQALSSGAYLHNSAVVPGSVPQQLCGGTYRRRGRKRKAGAQGGVDTKLTYAERQQKRIARKFGKHGTGNELGDDELVRGAYEVGKRHYGKPRVAGSKRGRELRAQAALARFEAAKGEQKAQDLVSTDNTSDSEIEWSDSEYGDIEHESGSEDYVRVCGDEHENDEEASQELAEMQALSGTVTRKQGAVSRSSQQKESVVPDTQLSDEIETESEDDMPDHPNSKAADAETKSSGGSVTQTSDDAPPIRIAHTSKTQPSAEICPVCSLENDKGSLLCVACSNVLRPSLVKDSWHCTAQQCQDSSYLNAGDMGRCGICGSLRPVKPANDAAALGVMSADVLRWD